MSLPSRTWGTDTILSSTNAQRWGLGMRSAVSGADICIRQSRHNKTSLWHQSTHSVVPEKLEAPSILCWEKERLKSVVSARGDSSLGRDFWQVGRPPHRRDGSGQNVGSQWWAGPHLGQNFLVINTSHPLLKLESPFWTPNNGLRRSLGFFIYSSSQCVCIC